MTAHRHLFAIPLSCPVCAGNVALVNATAASNGLLAVAIVECHPCGREWEVTSRLLPHGPSRSALETRQAAKQAAKRRVRESVPA